MIFVDSQAAVKAIASVWCKSRLVSDCKNVFWTGSFPSTLGSGSKRNTGQWDGECTRWFGFVFWGRFNSWVWPPICHLYGLINGCAKHWGNRSSCYVSRCLWPDIDSVRTGWLLGSDKTSWLSDLSRLTAKRNRSQSQLETVEHLLEVEVEALEGLL